MALDTKILCLLKCLKGPRSRSFQNFRYCTSHDTLVKAKTLRKSYM